MKKKNSNRIRSCIIAILSISICVGICTGISRKYGLEAFADTTYSFLSILDPSTVSVDNGKSVSEIRALLPSRVSISVNASTPSASGQPSEHQETWPDVATVDWKDSPEGGTYDPSSREAQNLVWRGTVHAGTISYQNKNVQLSVDQTVLIQVSVRAKSGLPSDYANLKDGKFKQKTSSFGLSLDGSSTIDSSDVGTILDYAYENGGTTLKEGIDSIMQTKTHSLSIEIVAKKLSSSQLSDSEKTSLEKKAKSIKNDDDVDDDDVKIGNYFDISIYVTDNGNVKEKLKITDPGGSFSFSYKIPSDIVKSSSSSTSSSSSDNVKYTYYKVKKRYYTVVRYHGSDAYDVGLDYSTDTTLGFEVSEFSPFATAYYDKTSTSTSKSTSSTSSSSRTGSSSIASARTPTTGGTSSGNAAGGSRTGSGAPKTGDEFNAKLWIYFLVVGVVVALCAFILYQDTKDWRDEKKEAK